MVGHTCAGVVEGPEEGTKVGEAPAFGWASNMELKRGMEFRNDEQLCRLKREETEIFSE